MKKTSLRGQRAHHNVKLGPAFQPGDILRAVAVIFIFLLFTSVVVWIDRANGCKAAYKPPVATKEFKHPVDTEANKLNREYRLKRQGDIDAQ
jgi:hypothetical protein